MGIVPTVAEATGKTGLVVYDESSPVRLIVVSDIAGFRTRFLETMRNVLS